MVLGLLALGGATAAGVTDGTMVGMSGMSHAAPPGGFLGGIAGVIDPIAQPLMVVSFALLVATTWPRGRIVFGLTVLLSATAYVFMWVVGISWLSWVSLGVLAVLIVGVTVREARAMRCVRQAGGPAALSRTL